MTIEIMIHIKEVSERFNNHSLLGYCYLVSEKNALEQLERKKENKQVFTSIDDIEQNCYNLECALNNLIQDEISRYTVDYSYNLTEEQEAVLTKKIDSDKRYYCGYMAKVNHAIKEMLNEF